MKKKYCPYCDFVHLDRAYGRDCRRGEFKFKNGFEGWLRKDKSHFELVVSGEEYSEETVEVRFCPWCGKELK